MLTSPPPVGLLSAPGNLYEALRHVRGVSDPRYLRGFNDVTTANGIYYQLWQNGKATVNTGTTGLENFGTYEACSH